MGNFAELYLLTIWGLEHTYPFTIIHPSSRKYDRMRATRKIMGFIFRLEYRNRWPYISSKMFFLRLYIRKEIYYTTIISHQEKKVYLKSDILVNVRAKYNLQLCWREKIMRSTWSSCNDIKILLTAILWYSHHISSLICCGRQA